MKRFLLLSRSSPNRFLSSSFESVGLGLNLTITAPEICLVESANKQDSKAIIAKTTIQLNYLSSYYTSKDSKSELEQQDITLTLQQLELFKCSLLTEVHTILTG